MRERPPVWFANGAVVCGAAAAAPLLSVPMALPVTRRAPVSTATGGGGAGGAREGEPTAERPCRSLPSGGAGAPGWWGGAALGSQTGRGRPVLRRVRRRPGRAVAQRGEGAPLRAARALLPPRPGLGRRASPAERGGDVGVGKLKLL